MNRPDFRELAPFEFTDIVGGRAVVGNPELRRAKITNADLRWEWFPKDGGGDGEVVAATAFWKDFKDPIEKVVEATAAFRTSFANAKGARNVGFELEGRKSLGPNFLAGLNYTFTDSQIELERGTAQIQTNLNRPLAGQAPHVLNAMLEFRTAGRELVARVLWNFFDDRIADVGVLGTPDILEEGRSTLDVVVTRSFGTWALRPDRNQLDRQRVSVFPGWSATASVQGRPDHRTGRFLHAVSHRASRRTMYEKRENAKGRADQ